jgi:hypothetical protein
MTSRQWTGTILAVACLTVFTWGCGGTPTGPTTPQDGNSGASSNGGGGSGGGGTPQPATTGILRVKVDASCSGNDSNIQVSVDSAFLGTAQPGDGGVSKTVSVGDHSVSATGQRGTHWGPTSVTVGAAGFELTLRCAGTPAPSPQPTSATLRVQVDGNCAGKAANIEVSIDGLFAGTTQPGSSGVSKSVSIGNHTIFGKASNGTTWPTFTVAVPGNGFVSNLTCR